MLVDDDDDCRLVAAVETGQPDALERAYERHAATVRSLALRVTGDPSLADDVVQEVFLRLWRAPTKVDPARGSLRSYLLVQTHGRAVDLVRANHARRHRELRDVQRSAPAVPDVELEVCGNLVALSVSRAVAALPSAERAAIELAYFGGCTYREVAVALGEPEGTVKSRIRAGLKRLRGSVGELRSELVDADI